MSQEIDLYNRIANPVEAIEALGKWFAKSGMAGCQNEAQGIVLAWECMARRKSPSDIVAENHIVDGRLTKKSLAIAARFQEQGGKIKWTKTGNDGKEAEAQYSIDGDTVTANFSIEDAKRQGLSFKPNSNWLKTPGNMLRARCHTNGIGMLRPGLVLGLTADDPEESPEIAEPKPLLKTKSEREPKQSKATESKTIDLAPSEVIVQPSEPLVAETPERKKVSSWSNPKDPQKVSAEGAAALQEAIGEANAETVLRWLEAKNWIDPKGSLLNLSPARAQRIYRDTEQFLSHVKGTQAAKG